ncbi:dephospho-CoA kinase [Granulicoccus phenolivorans]|uniref:dephospho-CoA kinase n=1 Tax=Granulicoccus phenolivorans TaxID=266854 RepID=UPI00047DBBD2|nr:dephospho-CoA kinase [Granulicoccus phenolivorans]
MLEVGLTGGIGSGKTTVADLWARRGAVLIDADLVAREVVEPGTPGLAAIAERFGADILRADGTLNRPALGQVVFHDDVARADLEEITHPAIRARVADLTRAAAERDPGAIVILVNPLLVEMGQADQFDVVVVVDVTPEVQLQRVMGRDRFTAEQAQARIRAQATRDQRLAVADYVIDNSGTLEQLQADADRVWQELQERSVARRP